MKQTWLRKRTQSIPFSTGAVKPSLMLHQFWTHLLQEARKMITVDNRLRRQSQAVGPRLIRRKLLRRIKPQ